MSDIKRLEEVMLKQFELLNKRMESHENLTVQLIGIVKELKAEAIEKEVKTRLGLDSMKSDIEFVFKENAQVKLDVERLKRKVF